jgi:phosphoenolpyruvate carboxykinase (GTP)
MLPFCGYHMGDYLRHWIDVGKRTSADKLPRVFFVNWFRKAESGRWLWPGYGENSRVLAWVFERCEGGGRAMETPIGMMPTLDAIERPRAVSAEDMAALLAVDREAWIREVADIRANHFPKLGGRLPQELLAELGALEARLEA